MKIRIRQLLLFLLPLPFVYLSFTYKDYFYLVPAVVGLAFALVFSKEGILSQKKIGLPDVKLLKPKRLGIKLPKIKAVKKLKGKSFYKRLGKYSFSGLTILLLAFTAIFIFITVYKLPNEPKPANTLLAYFQAYFNFAKENLFLVNIFILFSMLFVGVQLRRKKKQKRLYLIFLSVFTTLILTFFSLGFAFLGAFFYGVSEVGILSYRIKANPASVGVVWGKDKIIEEIKNKGEAPKLVGVDASVDKVIFELTLEEDRAKSNFYRERVAKNIPNTLLPSLGLPRESLILYKDYLLITELVKADIEAVSPIIGKLYLKRQLAPRYIKDEPKVQVMGRQEYLKYREDKINEQLDKVDSLISEAQGTINSLYSTISQAKQKIAENENGINESIRLRDYYYEQCKSAGYYSYYFGYFYRYYSDEECNRRKTQWDSLIADFQQNINDWNAVLAQSQKALPEWQEWKQTLEYARGLIATQKDITPQELGIFEPDKTVKVVLDYVSSRSVADFYATLVHEYLHYTSYVSGERELLSFFEEGITEYFTRRIIKEELDTSTNLGYPLIVKIIAEMSKKIPEETLLDIYFNKDEKLLRATLNSIYGKDFYEESERYFFFMSYVSSKEALKIANNIMFKIGGAELTEKDLESTYTGLK